MLYFRCLDGWQTKMFFLNMKILFSAKTEVKLSCIVLFSVSYWYYIVVVV